MTVMIDVTKSGERIKVLKKQCGLTSPEIADMRKKVCNTLTRY